MIRHILAKYRLDTRWVAHHVTAESLEYMFPQSRAFGDTVTREPSDHPAPPLDNEELMMNFYADVVVMERRFGVTFTVLDDTSPGNYMGWPSVTVSGIYENVFACIAVLWGANEDFDSMADFVGMLIGDDDASKRWNS